MMNRFGQDEDAIRYKTSQHWMETMSSVNFTVPTDAGETRREFAAGRGIGIMNIMLEFCHGSAHGNRHQAR